MNNRYFMQAFSLYACKPRLFLSVAWSLCSRDLHLNIHLCLCEVHHVIARRKRKSPPHATNFFFLFRFPFFLSSFHLFFCPLLLLHISVASTRVWCRCTRIFTSLSWDKQKKKKQAKLSEKLSVGLKERKCCKKLYPKPISSDGTRVSLNEKTGCTTLVLFWPGGSHIFSYLRILALSSSLFAVYYTLDPSDQWRLFLSEGKFVFAFVTLVLTSRHFHCFLSRSFYFNCIHSSFITNINYYRDVSNIQKSLISVVIRMK